MSASQSPTAIRLPTVIPTTDLKLLIIGCPTDNEPDRILGCVYVPQFKHLDTIHSSLPLYYIEAVVTDGSSHTFGLLHFIGDSRRFHLLWHFGVVITTLCLDQSLRRLDELAAYGFLWSFDATQLPEFNARQSRIMPGTHSPWLGYFQG